MASPSYDGGATGGKIRKRPLRRPTSTPYDRPRSAAAENSGWLSKLVDPASRLITGSASKIFSSVFRKRLTAPDENHQSRQEVPEIASDVHNPSSQLQDQGYNNGDNPMNSSNTDGISELEQLLEKKTFTRVEFDHLTELLRSRTSEPVTLEPEIKNEKKEKEKENGSTPENKAGKSGLYGSFSTPVGNAAIPHDDPALPTELAKAYMGSRPSTLSTHSKVFQENTPLPSIVPYVPKPFEMSVAPRSATHFSGFSKLHANEYATPKAQGRSTMCRMSCSPYFKVYPTPNVRVEKPIRDVYTGASSSQSTPRNILQSGGNKVLKRGSLVLDHDFESFGPIRRVRQRSHFMSPSKDSLSTPFNKNLLRGSSSVCKPSRFDEHKYRISGTQDAENGKNTMLYAIPPKSSETAMKILQQLDKLVASPKDGSTVKLFNEQNGGGVDNSHESELSKLRSPPSGNQNRVVEENAPSKPAVTGVNLTTEACIVDKAAIPSTNASPGTGTSGSAALTPRTSFHVIAPEDSLVLDDDNYKTVAPVREAGRRASGSSAVAEKNAGFDLPTMPTSSLDVSTLPKEQVGAAVSNVGSMASPPLPIKSSVTDTVCQTVGASDTATGTMIKGSISDGASEMEEPANSCRTFENATTSSIMTSTEQFAASQNNGSVPSPSLAFPVFDGRVTSTFSTSTSTSFVSPSGEKVGAFEFGSSTTFSSPQKVDLSDSTDSQEKQFKETGFAVNNSSASAQPSTPSLSFQNSTFGANPFTGPGFPSAAPKSDVGLSSGSPGKDEMNVEKSISPFGQPASSIALPTFTFGSTTASAGPPVFQFGAQPNPSIPQNSSPFNPGFALGGSLIPQSPSPGFVAEGSLVSQSSLPFQAGNPPVYAPGGGFSLGSGGGDKSGRKFFRAKRKK